MSEHAPPPEDDRRELELVVYERKQQRRFQLPRRGEVVIGRSNECDVRLDDKSISRRHAALHLGAFQVEDLGSKNGSWLFGGGPDMGWESVMEGQAGKGLRLQPGVRHDLDPGRILKLGSVVICFQQNIPALHTEPVRGEEPLSSDDVVLADAEMLRVYELAARVAPSTLPVLILGETGVGKDVIAAHIHRSSPRHAGPFVRVNCGALSASLLESELFGHQRGAFTGAAADKPGLLELGHGGTVFLDEIGELPPQTQVKLLHVLETGEVTRVGGTRSKHIDVRYVAATNRELAREVQLGTFRRDLYFRINSVPLKLTPLRERTSEIEPLARHFLRRFCAVNSIPQPELGAAAIEHMNQYSWPGNVRELKNAMERAALMCGAGQVLPVHLPSESEFTGMIRRSSNSLPAPNAEVTATHSRAALVGGIPPHERIAEALQKCAGNQTRAARLLGISRRTLVKWLDQCDLPRPRKRMQ